MGNAVPTITDLKSATMMATIDYDFSKFDQASDSSKFDQASDSQVGCCLHAKVLDASVTDYLQQHPQGTIVEFRAGLNTRFERVGDGQLR